MGLISQDIIQAVIDRSDIIDIIGRYVALKKYGSNFKALCPFHHEKTPSFVVNPDKQIFHCFGCSAGGNVVGFVMRHERMEFPHAIRFLAELAGIDIPEDHQDTLAPSKKLKDEIYRVNELAVQFFHETLLTSREPEAKTARDYLKARSVDLETVKKFRLGYAPGGWDALIGFLSNKGVSQETMHQAGLIIAREKGGYYDRFRGRVIFPIFDIHSRPVAFGARSLDKSEGAKYINSPETLVYTKGKHLYGLHLTKTSVGEKDAVVVVEGYMDMIMPFIHGVSNIAASLGTALTVEQIRLIRRYTTQVVMLFDTDPAGQAAIIRCLDLLIDEGMNVKVVTLAKDQDPDSFIREFGVSAFEERIKQAYSLFDHKYNWLLDQFDPNTVDGKTKICQEMLGTIGRFKSEVTKFELMRLLAKRLSLPEEVVSKQAQNQKQPGPQTIRPIESIQKPKTTIRQTPKNYEELLIMLFLDDHQWIAKAQGSLELSDFTEGLARDVVAKIWQMNKDVSDWQTSGLMSQVSDPSVQEFLARILTDANLRIIDAPKLFQDCLGRIVQDRLKMKRKELMEKIKEAEDRCDMQAVEQLRFKFQELIKMNTN